MTNRIAEIEARFIDRTAGINADFSWDQDIRYLLDEVKRMQTQNDNQAATIEDYQFKCSRRGKRAIANYVEKLEAVRIVAKRVLRNIDEDDLDYDGRTELAEALAACEPEKSE